MTFTDHNQPNDKIYAALLLGCILCIAAFFIAVCSGCSAEKKQYAKFRRIEKETRKAEKKQAKMYGKFDKLKRKADADSVLKVVPPKWSLDNFPVKISGKKTVYLPSKKIITHDTVTKISQVNDTIYLTKTITKHSHSVDTLHTTDTILDNRPLTQLQHDYRQIDAKATQYKASEQIAKERLQNRTNKMWWSIGLNLLLLLLIAIFILRRIGIIR
jgi:lipopolysaccharide export LptBFGC system permease protein LptF